jgi:hypothetical protein
MAGTGTLAMEMDGIPLLSIFFNFHDQILFGAGQIFSPKYRKQIYDRMVRETGSEGVKTETGNQWETRFLTII